MSKKQKLRIDYHFREQLPAQIDRLQSRKPGSNRCPTCGKVKYATKEEAEKQIPANSKHRAYKSPPCGNVWHLGHTHWKQIISNRKS